jgi:hypothetical protein|tara:strand:+ start:215 stop:502 length:288 start_codon:yes stop_codon:yes gene_type:complete
MNIQERGDALLTAYVNKDFKEVAHLFGDLGRQTNANPCSHEPIIALHKYKNPSITDTKVCDAIVESFQSLVNTPGAMEEIQKETEARKVLNSLKK